MQGAAEHAKPDKSTWDGQSVKYKLADKNKKHKGTDEEKMREKPQWKEGGKKKNDDRGKAEWAKEEHEREKFNKEKYNKGRKLYGEEKDSARRGDEGKSWKDKKGDKEWKENTDRKEWNEAKDWKKAKQLNQDKQMKGQKQDWKGTAGEKHKGSEEWKDKEGYRESSKEKWDKKHQKDKEGKREWKNDGEWRNGKDQSKEGKWRSEKVQAQKDRDPRKDGKGWGEHKQQKEEWKSRTDDKGRKKEERNQQNNGMSRDGRYEKGWKRDDKKQWEPRERGKSKDGSRFHGHEHKILGHHGDHEAHPQEDRKRRPSVKQPEYWLNQRSRLQRNPKPPHHCHSVETCAHTEGLPPVTFHEFQSVLQTYLARAKEVGVDASVREELQKLATEFFKDGLFVHDQMRFQDFVEDLGDVLEDMVEGDDDDGDEEDSDIEEEMEGFQREVMRRFSAGGKQERAKGDRRKESRRGQA